MSEPDEIRYPCVGCGALNPPGVEACIGCGYRFAGSSTPPPSPSKPLSSSNADPVKPSGIRLAEDEPDNPYRPPEASIGRQVRSGLWWFSLIFLTTLASVIAFGITCTTAGFVVVSMSNDITIGVYTGLAFGGLAVVGVIILAVKIARKR